MGVGRSKVPTTYASSCFQKNPLPVTCQDFKKNWRRVRERGWEGGGGGGVAGCSPGLCEETRSFLVFHPTSPLPTFNPRESLSLSLSQTHTQIHTHPRSFLEKLRSTRSPFFFFFFNLFICFRESASTSYCNPNKWPSQPWLFVTRGAKVRRKGYEIYALAARRFTRQLPCCCRSRDIKEFLDPRDSMFGCSIAWNWFVADICYSPSSLSSPSSRLCSASSCVFDLPSRLLGISFSSREESVGDLYFSVLLRGFLFFFFFVYWEFHNLCFYTV